MHIIAIANNKGGVGKTTSSVNIAAGLASHGKKVLLIDLDPQANASQHLGVTQPESTISDVLKGEKQLSRSIISIENSSTDGLFDLIASERSLNQTCRWLDTEPGRELKLKNLLKNVKSRYDYILMDCMPALNVLTHNALTAASEVYIPVQAQYLALHGLSALTEEIETIKESLNKKLRVGGVIITQYDARTILNRDILKSIVDTYGDVVFKTVIRQNIALAEAPTAGKDAYAYAPESNGAKDYRSLVEEILNRA